MALQLPFGSHGNTGGAPAPGPAHPGQGFELGDVLRIFSEHRRILGGAVIAGLLLGVLATVLMTPRYRAEAMMQLNADTDQLLGNTKDGGGSSTVMRFTSQEVLSTQIGLLKSEALARRVAEDLNLAANAEFGGSEGTREQRINRAVQEIRANTAVDAVKNSLLIKITFTSRDPQLAAKVANGLASGSISASIERRYDASAYARKFLNDQLSRTKTALEESERAINDYSIKAQLFRAPGRTVEGQTMEGQTLAAANLTATQASLNETRIQRVRAEQAFRTAGVDFQAEQAAGLSSLIDQRVTLQAQYEENLKLFQPDYPAMRELSAKIERLNNAISGERSRWKGNKIDELRAVYEAALRSEEDLNGQISLIKGDVESERSRMIQYNILQREVDTNRALYDALLQRYKQVGVASGVSASNVSLVDPARAPRAPFKPKLLVNLAIGLLLGFAAGIGLAFVMSMLFDTIVDGNDVRQKLHLPVLGVIPMVEDDRSLMEALSDRKSDVSEAYYSVRTALTFSREGGAPKTLLVTSSRAGEGKSTTSFAIASTMARLGSKVLLIDADLRKPTFVSSREDGYGLAHLLGSEEPLAEYAESTQVENLKLLPVGRFVGSPAELLSSNRLPAIIAEATGNFDMVVIDGPPVLGLTDAPLLASVAESTALVVQSRESRTGNVNDIIRRIRESGGSVIGVVLTMVTKSGVGYGYDYAYYSYSYGTGEHGGKVSSDPMRRLDIGQRDD